MGRVFSTEGYDGPSPAWEARQSRAAARRPLCDEYGTPLDEDDSDESADDGGGGDDDAPEGEGGGE
jgi:hypothetical protein